MMTAVDRLRPRTMEEYIMVSLRVGQETLFNSILASRKYLTTFELRNWLNHTLGVNFSFNFIVLKKTLSGTAEIYTKVDDVASG